MLITNLLCSPLVAGAGLLVAAPHTQVASLAKRSILATFVFFKVLAAKTTARKWVSN
jgi:hypothetical protein